MIPNYIKVMPSILLKTNRTDMSFHTKKSLHARRSQPHKYATFWEGPTTESNKQSTFVSPLYSFP